MKTITDDYGVEVYVAPPGLCIYTGHDLGQHAVTLEYACLKCGVRSKKLPQMGTCTPRLAPSSWLPSSEQTKWFHCVWATCQTTPL